MSKPRLCVLGLGYVGLPTALLFAKNGYQVHGVDIDPAVVRMFEAADGVAERYPELADWWQAVAQTGNFSASDTPVVADVYLITVPTPVDNATKWCDLRAVKAAARAVAEVLPEGAMVILESTVPPGTTRTVLAPILESRPGIKADETIDVCFSPERILPGHTCHELIHNHRVIGGLTPQAAERACALFADVIQGEIHLTDDRTAEFCKLAENTYRDVNIALANELAMIADAVGVDIREARPLINQHPRVNLLEPGIGVGGHCIAVDPWFFVELAPELTELIGTSRRVNDRRPAYCARQILTKLEGVPQPRVCVAGLTYKPNVGDLRESPAIRIVEFLEARDVDVERYDPLADVGDFESLSEAASGCHALIILVRHQALLTDLSENKAAITAALQAPGLILNP